MTSQCINQSNENDTKIVYIHLYIYIYFLQTIDQLFTIFKLSFVPVCFIFPYKEFRLIKSLQFYSDFPVQALCVNSQNFINIFRN